MSDELVIRCCAPTLAAIKTGSLFNCPFESQAELTESLRLINRCLIQKGVRAFPLRYLNGRALIYLFRPQMLERDLQNPVAESILRENGYPEGTPMTRILYLIRRLRECESFPHEIGLFLGYPAVDVRGFIEHKECKCTGLWKVFESDEEEAKRIFARCRRCTNAYVRRNQEGWSLSRLTIGPRQFSYKSESNERKVSA
ncbi:MAG: DUF3793 family protein [Clostridia bacterium]|nr:DUF3793 family protein [Clostridia bacterium]MBR1586622.1 DUF3793 family protein [Clostridia bacterium]